MTTDPTVTNSVVVWHSDNPAVSTIDNNGLATTLIEGTANITATYRGLISNPIPLTVTAPELTTIDIMPTTATIYLHHTDTNKMRQQFTANGTFSNNSVRVVTQSVDWSSSDTNRATMDLFYKGLAQRIYIPNVTTPGKVTISAASDAATCNPAELNVECRIYTQYQQNAGPWATQLYAYHKSPWFIPPLKTIRQKGCALTSTAMALSGNGTHIDPGWLDTMMTTPPATVNVYATQIFPMYTFYDTGNGVNFTATLSYFGNITGTGIKFNQIQWINYLNNCKTIIAQLPGHYVFIYKYSNGNFIAYDPMYPGESIIEPGRIINGVLCSY